MRPIVIGAGHNGLTAAFYLAKAGLKPLVLEQRETVGGGSITGTLLPGFRCPTLTHHAFVRADIASDMNLARYGLEFLRPPVQAFAPPLDGPPLIVNAGENKTAEAMRGVGARDAEAFVAYRSLLDRLCGVMASLLTSPAPDIASPRALDLWRVAQTARRFRALERREAYRLLRWTSMPVADLAAEWFESDLLRAFVAAPGLSGTMLGPRSAGSTLVLLLREANRRLAHPSSRPRGGPGALADAMAAAAADAGAEIRTGARVERILVHGDRAGAVAVDGRELPASVVVSALDPKTTFLRLVDPAALMPDFLSKVRGYRSCGTLAKVNLALSGLPAFAALAAAQPSSSRDAAHTLLAGDIHLGPDLDYLERAFDHAKYGELSPEPWLDVTIPSILDPDLAPPGAHVMSIYVHYAPYLLRSSSWPAAGETLLKHVTATLDRFAPGIPALIVGAEVITPLDLESRHGFHGGHVFHGELAPDQLASMRPVLGHSRYDSPVRGLYLCSAGTHPGGFMSGGSGRMAAREVLAASKRRR